MKSGESVIKPAPLLPMSPRNTVVEPPAVKSSGLPPAPKRAPLPTLSKKKVESSAVKSVLPVSPKSALPVVKKSVLPVSPKSVLPVSPKSVLPVVKKSVLPVVKKSVLPVVKKSVLPSPKPIQKDVSTAPKMTLPVKNALPILKKSALPSKAPLPSLKNLPANPKKTVSPLAKEVKEQRKEIIQEISRDVAKETVKKSSALPPMVSQDMKSLMGPLKPLASMPIFQKEKAGKALPKAELPKLESSLKIARAGVSTALDIEPEASFQMESPSLATIASPANLPTKKSKDKTPKIRIPKIISSSVKPSPKKKNGPVLTTGIALPTSSTIIPPIPITSPSTMSISTTPKTEQDTEMMKNITGINLAKLKSDRVGKNEEAYSVAELKSIAGSLKLTKSGNKKELVERIKNVILKFNPSAFN